MSRHIKHRYLWETAISSQIIIYPKRIEVNDHKCLHNVITMCIGQWNNYWFRFELTAEGDKGGDYGE